MTKLRFCSDFAGGDQGVAELRGDSSSISSLPWESCLPTGGLHAGAGRWCNSTAVRSQPSHPTGKRTQWVAVGLCEPGAFPSEVHTLSAF